GDGQGVAVDARVADDYLRGAHELADFDHGRTAEHGVRRQMKLLVCALARPPGNGAEATRVHVVGHQHRNRFAEPVGPAVAAGRLERDHENPRLGWAVYERERQKRSDHAATAVPAERPSVTESTQPLLPPDARHSFTRASATTSNNCSTRAMAAA